MFGVEVLTLKTKMKYSKLIRWCSHRVVERKKLHFIVPSVTWTSFDFIHLTILSEYELKESAGVYRPWANRKHDEGADANRAWQSRG